MLHLKIYANSTDFVWPNKDCKQISSSLTKKGIFCLLGSSIPFNDSNFFHPNIHKWIDEWMGLKFIHLCKIIYLLMMKWKTTLVRIFLCLILDISPRKKHIWLHLKIFIKDYLLFFIPKRCVTYSQIQVHFNKRSNKWLNNFWNTIKYYYFFWPLVY